MAKKPPENDTNPFGEQPDVAFGMDYGPPYPFVSIPEGKTVTLCLIERAPQDTYWSHPTDMDARRIRDADKAAALGYSRHDVYLVYVHGANGNGKPCETEGAPDNIAKLDVKGFLWWSLKNSKGIKPGAFVSIARSGNGKQTEYVITHTSGPRAEAHAALLAHRAIKPADIPF